MAATISWIPGPWPGRLGIAPRPRGGEWLSDESRSWRDAGIDVVVSLLEPGEEVELALTGESTAARASGLDFRALPIPDRGVPHSREEVVHLAGQILDALRSGKTVVVHCRQGLGRSVMMAAAALIAGGLDAETALDAIRQSRGPDVPETPAQKQWIFDFSSWRSRTRAAQQGHPGVGAPRRS